MSRSKTIIAAVIAASLALPALAMAQAGAQFENPLKFNTVDAVATSFLEALQATIVVLAMVFIVIAGILYLTSAGDERRIGMAKTALWAALIGLAIAIAAPTFLKEIYTILDARNAPAVTAGAPSAAEIASRTLTFLLGIAGTIALIALVIGGIMYLAAAGDERRIDTGKKIFVSALIGLFIIFGALVAVRTVASFFIAGAGTAAPGAGAPAASTATGPGGAE